MSRANHNGTTTVASGAAFSVRTAGFALILALAGVVWTPLAAGAATAPSLGTVTSFGVLAGSAITNTGPTSITGDVGLSPGSAVTGFPPGTVSGAKHVDDAVSVQAKSDLTTAYNTAAGQPCTSTLTGDLGGRTLTPGVYCYPSAALLTGTLTLNGGGDPHAVFIFKVGSMLTTASNSRVALVNGGPCGVYWQIGSSATLGTDTAFVGTMLVNTSITLNTRANILPGRALTQTGAVTLDSNRIIRPDTCSTPVASDSSATSLASSVNPSASGGAVVLSSTVTSSGAGSPTGSVTFEEGSTVLGTVPLDSGARATLTTARLTVGAHTVTALYTGATGVLPSISIPVIQTVTATPTSPQLLTPQVGAGGDGPAVGTGLVMVGTLLLLLSGGWRARRAGW